MSLYVVSLGKDLRTYLMSLYKQSTMMNAMYDRNGNISNALIASPSFPL